MFLFYQLPAMASEELPECDQPSELRNVLGDADKKDDEEEIQRAEWNKRCRLVVEQLDVLKQEFSRIETAKNNDQGHQEQSIQLFQVCNVPL